MHFINHELELARDFVKYTGSNIFLTGRAGTGKTTFLHTLQEQTPKRMIITAPTGVAAINAGGVTLHSFFQLSFGPFVPGSEAYEGNSRRQFRFSREKRQIIKSLDLLVIDEISMVRADLLDAVDAVLRRLRRNDQPFGGVQLLMIGDLHQLPPVAKQNDWALLKQYYETVYFFSSKALDLNELVTIELKHIYRQSDQGFINILNQVRENRLDEAAAAELNRRFIPGFTPAEDQGYITLTTHNNSAESINRTRLSALTGKGYNFRAEISGDFPDHIFPTPGDLQLKEGAQVMFLRNDPSPEKLYYNGKIGRISKISSGTIRVVCPDDEREILVDPVDWENIKYTLDQENKEIKEEVIGRFKQYPLKLAWAITIHKSQGLTFDKAVIDAGAAFAHGQVYVALSRCKTLDGLVLTSPLDSRGVLTDHDVMGFDENAHANQPSQTRLMAAKISYQQKLLLTCFDFTVLRSHLNYLVRLLTGNSRVVRVSGAVDISGLEAAAVKDIFTVGEKFRRQLISIFEGGALPESDAHILERIGKASVWFQEKFAVIFGESVGSMRIETDNAELRKRIDKVLNNLKKEIGVKLAGVASCRDGFNPTAYLRAVANAEIDFTPLSRQKSRAPSYTASDIEHPELFQSMKDWRTRKAKEEGVPAFQVMHQRVLIQIVIFLPDNMISLMKIQGVGAKTMEKYGRDIVKIVGDYRKKHGIEKVVVPEPKKSPEKPRPGTKSRSVSDTKQTSMDMFNRGMTIAEIAEERGLVTSTIENHLAFFVEKGELDITRLVTPEKQKAIEKVLAEDHGDSFRAVKEALGEGFSYGEIRMVVAHQKHLQLE